MKPLFPRLIFTVILYTKTGSTIPSKNLLQVARFSTAPSQSSHHSSYQSRRHEEDGRNVKVSVWWDFENCTLPSGVNVFRIAHSITAAVRAVGIKGPIQITAFGDIVQLPRANQEALSSTGINLTHIPNGAKSSGDRSLLVDLMYWVSQNPPPAHLFLISGDNGFAGVLHRLRMNNYNILLASPENASSALFSAASIMWQWNGLLRGEDLTGKHFNHPPDGPYGSWYGQYKVPLEDPFAAMECSSSPRSEEPSDSNSDPKPRPIPKAVTKYIRHILGSNAKGILITDLRAELAKSSLSIDKDFYGYKKFSRFLLSMPHILKLQPSGSQLLVHSAVSKSSEQKECTSGNTVEPIPNAGEPESVVARKLNNTKSSCAESSNEMALPTPYSIPKVENPSQKGLELTTKVQCPLQKGKRSAQEATTETQVSQHGLHEPPSSSIQVTKTEATGSQLHTAEDNSSANSQGLLKRLWKNWFGNKDHDAKETESSSSYEIPAEQTASQSENITSLDPLKSGDDAKVDGKTTVSSEAIIDKSSSESGFFNHIKNLIRSRRSTPPQNNSNLECDMKALQNKPGSGTHEIFLKDSFWKDMEAFLDTKQGSTLVLQSRTRLQMSQNLKERGPASLRSLCESDLLHMVDLLVSDKKWVEERIHRTFPFRVSRPAVKATNNASNSSTGLISIFQNTQLPTNPPKPQEQDGEKKHQNPPHSGVSQPVSEESSFGKSRNETLVDCLKLVQDIVKEYPQGYNLGSFRKLFLETHGYSLDLQKLGYPKLVNLLNIMPGIKIESNHIVPSGKFLDSPTGELHSKESSGSGASSDSKLLLNASRKADDLDSPWAELGPISKKDEMEYEPLSDDDFSDLDEESTSCTKLASAKAGTKEEESSLLQILDSWYSRKEESGEKGSSEKVDGIVECNSELLASSSETAVNSGKRSKVSKSYSFVSDQPEDCKNELIDGILSSLNKSGAPKT